MTNGNKDSLERIFCPEGLAIFGVSATKMGSFGSLFLKANMDSGFDGKIYPIGPKGGEVHGMKIYKSLDEVPGQVDLASIAVPAQHVLPILDDCLKHGVAGVEIQSAGFSELATEEGKRVENEIAAFGKKGLRIIGPNCFGIHCPYCGLTILPGGAFPKNRGSVAFFGQSGGMAVDLGYMAPGLGFGWRRMVSYGNSCDIDASELLRVFADDDECKVITGYVEGVKDGRSFFEALKYASRKKPVVLWKAGLTQSGSRAVMSHTGSMGGGGTVWRAAMKQAGAVPVFNQEDMLDTVLAFLYLGEWMGKGIGVVGGGGALGVASADTAELHGFTLPEFSDSAREAMQAMMPPVGTSFKNPADVGNPGQPPQILGPIMEHAANDPEIDIIILIQIIHHMTFLGRMHAGNPDIDLMQISFHEKMTEACRAVQDKTGVPVIEVMPPISSEFDKLEVEAVLRKARETALANGILNYPNLTRAISSMKRVAAYWKWRKQ